MEDSSAARRKLIDLVNGGDGVVDGSIQELDPPHGINGHAYRYRLVEAAPTQQDPAARNYYYVDTLEQAEILTRFGDLEV